MPKTYPPPQLRHIFDWLEQVRLRPSMFFSRLGQLENMVYGYYAGLAVHAIHEDVPEMTSHFSTWLRYRYRSWSLSLGWAHAITSHTKDEQAAAEHFFELVEAYRKLRPVVRARVRLTARQLPLERIEVVQYAPKPLHFVRYHFGSRVVNGRCLTAGPEARLKTTLAEARRWVEEHHAVRPEAWETDATSSRRRRGTR
ncbi:hypothetical protein [Hyalangium rubrum]|uniref:Uncharacterized protein n=1 Tax=Hyalangium rubrum TaxID=3103134 RepID=A0ABU5HH59_9BACT|nr:hypothetical protein [Hyalangium sp. s54d21]MDY7232477.1 hypothetical protein [Hyalangium sp. s54d21]